jgi:hypothetical protein
LKKPTYLNSPIARASSPSASASDSHDKSRRHAQLEEATGGRHQPREKQQHDADCHRRAGRRHEQRLACHARHGASARHGPERHAEVPEAQCDEHQTDAPGDDVVQWNLVGDRRDMRGISERSAQRSAIR